MLRPRSGGEQAPYLAADRFTPNRGDDSRQDRGDPSQSIEGKGDISGLDPRSAPTSGRHTLSQPRECDIDLEQGP